MSFEHIKKETIDSIVRKIKLHKYNAKIYRRHSIIISIPTLIISVVITTVLSTDQKTSSIKTLSMILSTLLSILIISNRYYKPEQKAEIHNSTYKLLNQLRRTITLEFVTDKNAAKHILTKLIEQLHIIEQYEEPALFELDKKKYQEVELSLEYDNNTTYETSSLSTLDDVKV